MQAFNKYFYSGDGGRGVPDRVSLCSPACPGTHCIDQASLKFRDLPVSVSQVLGLKACAITPILSTYFNAHQP